MLWKLVRSRSKEEDHSNNWPNDSVYTEEGLTEKVAAETKKQLDISLSAPIVRNWARESRMFGRVATKKPYVNKMNVSSSLRKYYRNRLSFGKLFYDLTNQNSNFSALTAE